MSGVASDRDRWAEWLHLLGGIVVGVGGHGEVEKGSPLQGCEVESPQLGSDGFRGVQNAPKHVHAILSQNQGEQSEFGTLELSGNSTHSIDNG